jgi:hypothetical protein
MPKYPLTVDTLGVLIDARHHLQPHCDDCGEGLSVNMQRLASKIGRDFYYIGRRFPLRCPVCGSDNVSTRISSAAAGRQAGGGDLRVSEAAQLELPS